MGILSYGYKGLKTGATKLAQKLSGQSKDTGKVISTIKPGTSLKAKRESQDNFIKFQDKIHQNFDKTTKNKLKMKQPLYKINKNISNIRTPDEPKLAKGGRVGRKLGGGMDMSKKKTNVQKIKETFGPKKNVPSNLKGFSKLPEAVQQKMNKKLARKV